MGMAKATQWPSLLCIPLLIHVLRRQACERHAAEPLYTPRACNSYPSLALTDFPPYRILSQMMKSPSLTPMTPYCPSDTCSKADAFRNYEEVAAELLLDVRQGGVALGSNKITKSGSQRSEHIMQFCCGRCTRCAGAAVRMT